MKRKVAAGNYALKLTVASATHSASMAAAADESEDKELSSDTDSDTVSSTIPSEPEAGPSTSKDLKVTARGTVGLVTAEVSAALDRTNTSDRKAAHILSAIASTGQMQQDVEKVVVSRSAIRRARLKHRDLLASEIKTSFNPSVPLVLHWDGKIMEDFSELIGFPYWSLVKML